MSKSGFEKNWFKSWFGDEYVEVYAHRDDQDAQHLIQLILENIPISKETKILDAACGNGRHACFLTNLTNFVYGVDLSISLLKQAKKKCGLKLVRGDIRALPLKQHFDVLLSVFTSFGYFFEEQENLKVLQEYYRVLKAEGFFFFDYLNANYVRKHLKERTEKTINSKRIVEERKIVGKRVEKKITIVQAGRKSEYLESVRLYERLELEQMLTDTGFEILKVFGDYHGQEFYAQSPRLIFLAKKKVK